MSPLSLFPDAVSAAYAFDNGYVAKPVLENGKGYWLKFNNVGYSTVSGFKAQGHFIDVKKGWNMIGPFENDVNVSAITSNPAGIIQAAFYEFAGGYKAVNFLTVGKGYWVKVSQDGVLEVPDFMVLSKEKDQSPSELANSNDWIKITVKDNSNNTAVLYLTPSTVSEEFELPPVPPSGIFDIRFSSGSYVESVQNTKLDVVINSADFPLTLHAKNLGDRRIIVSDESGELNLHEPIVKDGVVTLSEPLHKLTLSLSNNAQLPGQYALSQNYPNPFNPVTRIEFALPEASHVTMTLYNALGAKVAELLSSKLSAGYHDIELDAASYASGIYFYTLETANFKDMKKMVVLK